MSKHQANLGAEAVTTNLQCGLPSSFHFLTGNTSGEKREAHAYLAREVHRRKKLHDVNALKSRTRVQFAWRIKQGSHAAGENLDRLSTARAEAEEHDKRTLRRSNVILKALPPHYISTSPVHMLGKGSSDPFAAAAFPISATVNELMYYSRKWYVHWRWPIEGSAHEQSSAVIIWKDDMKNIIGNEANFHAALALAFQYMSQLHRESPANSRLLHSGVRHKIASLKSIRRHLQTNGSSFDVLPAIMDLGGIDFYDGNYHEMTLHIKAAKSVADAMGGLSKFNESVRNLIGLADSVICWRLFRRPIFPIEDWDPGRWCRQSFSRRYCLDTIIPEQYASTISGCASNIDIPTVLLREILNELNEMLLVQKLAFSLDHGQHRSEIFRWLHLRRSAIKVHLIHHYLDMIGTAESPTLLLGGLEETLAAAVCIAAGYCHGLIIYQIATVETHFPFRLLRSSLLSVLHRVDTERSISQLNLLLWLYFVGALAEELSKQHLPDDEKEILTKKFLTTAIRLNLTLDAARNVLRLFLYDEGLDRHLTALFLKLDCVSAA